MVPVIYDICTGIYAGYLSYMFPLRVNGEVWIDHTEQYSVLRMSMDMGNIAIA